MAKAKTKTAYVCSDCGAEHAKWQGQCNTCSEWNTLSRVNVGPIAERAVGFAGTVAAINIEGLVAVLNPLNLVDAVIGEDEPPAGTAPAPLVPVPQPEEPTNRPVSIIGIARLFAESESADATAAAPEALSLPAETVPSSTTEVLPRSPVELPAVQLAAPPTVTTVVTAPPQTAAPAAAPPATAPPATAAPTTAAPPPPPPPAPSTTTKGS